MSPPQLKRMIEGDHREMTHWIEFDGVKYQNLKQFAAAHGENHSTLLSRLSARGLSVYGLSEKQLRSVMS